MKKFITLISILSLFILLAGCNNIKPNTDVDTVDTNKEIFTLAEVNQSTKEELDENLIGISREELLSIWGEPDGTLSGFWGDIWQLDNETDKSIIVYYDNDGIVENIKEGNLSQ